MHILLTGARGVGKSTAIRRALDILLAGGAQVAGGFLTWKGGDGDLALYISPVGADGAAAGEKCRVASFNDEIKRMSPDIRAFETEGVRILREGAAGMPAARQGHAALHDANAGRANDAKSAGRLIIMDELGFLEGEAEQFKQAVYDTLEGDTPVLGALRAGDIPWHMRIKDNPKVTVLTIDESNRDEMPRLLVGIATFW